MSKQKRPTVHFFAGATLFRGARMARLKRGLHRTYISQLKRGQKSPSLKTVFKIDDALMIKPPEIMSKLEMRIL